MVHINHLSKRKKKENKRNNRSNNTAPAEFNSYNKDISLDAQTNPPRSQLNNEMDLAEGEGIKRVLFSWRGQHPPPIPPKVEQTEDTPSPPLSLQRKKSNIPQSVPPPKWTTSADVNPLFMSTNHEITHHMSF